MKETISVLKTQVEELSAEKGMSSRKIEDLQEELEVLRIELKSLVLEERKTAEENLEALQSNLEAERVVRSRFRHFIFGNDESSGQIVWSVESLFLF